MKKIRLAALITAAAALAATACEPTTSADPNLSTSPSRRASSKATSKATSRAGSGTAMPKAAPEASLPDGLHSITYKIEGTASRGMLTYTTPSGQEQTTRSLPWRKTFRAEDGEFLSVSAQNEGASGTIICTISVDGSVVKRARSSGAYTIASCDAMLGW